NLSLFAARRVMEIRLASGRPGTAGNAALIALLEARDPDTLFLILTPRLDRDAQGADWVRSVEAHGAWVQIWPVDSHRLVAWLKGEAARALRVLAGLRAEGTEPTLVLWALSRALRDVWSARGGDRPPASQQRHRAALEQALRRASRLPFAALALRAARVDRMIKGRVAGDAWDQLALLAADICGQ